VGGSTITQQLVKQTLLTNDRTIERKIKEAILTIILEREYTKDQILELYLNSSNFGGRVQGIKTAARAYFNKELADLAVNEAAFLMGLVQSPGELSPLYASDRERATELSNSRRVYILDQIKENPALLAYLNSENTGYLSEPYNQVYPIAVDYTQEDILAMQEDHLEFAPPSDMLRAAHWVFYVRDILQQEPYNLSLHDLYNGGYQIITSLDLRIQDIAEQKVREGVANYGYLGFQNASLVTIDARNGEILAMVGSKGYNLPNDKNNKRFDPKVNVAIAEQSLGSSLKPWVAYLAFTTNRYYPWTETDDKEVTFYGTYKPKNFDGRFLGVMSVKTALLQSRNLPWLQIAYDLGDWQLPRLMTEVGYNKTNQYGLAAVIGGVNESLLSHTAAYTGFANGGTVLAPVPILNINNAKGKEIFKADLKVLKELNRNAIQTVNDILGDKYYRGSGNYLKFFGNNKLAGKTGTSDNNRDAYYMGYNPKIVTGVWVGNNDNSPMSRNAYGSSTALPIWRSYMQTLLAHHPKFAEAGSY
jgi:penicillin-binding protein 1A